MHSEICARISGLSDLGSLSEAFHLVPITAPWFTKYSHACVNYHGSDVSDLEEWKNQAIPRVYVICVRPGRETNDNKKLASFHIPEQKCFQTVLKLERINPSSLNSYKHPIAHRNEKVGKKKQGLIRYWGFKELGIRHFVMCIIYSNRLWNVRIAWI